MYEFSRLSRAKWYGQRAEQHVLRESGSFHFVRETTAAHEAELYRYMVRFKPSQIARLRTRKTGTIVATFKRGKIVFGATTSKQYQTVKLEDGRIIQQPVECLQVTVHFKCRDGAKLVAHLKKSFGLPANAKAAKQFFS